MSVNIKVTGGLNIEWGQIDPKVTEGLIQSTFHGHVRVVYSECQNMFHAFFFCSDSPWLFVTCFLKHGVS